MTERKRFSVLDFIAVVVSLIAFSLAFIEDKLYEGKYNDNKIRLYYEDL